MSDSWRIVIRVKQGRTLVVGAENDAPNGLADIIERGGIAVAVEGGKQRRWVERYRDVRYDNRPREKT